MCEPTNDDTKSREEAHAVSKVLARGRTASHKSWNAARQVGEMHGTAKGKEVRGAGVSMRRCGEMKLKQIRLRRERSECMLEDQCTFFLTAEQMVLGPHVGARTHVRVWRARGGVGWGVKHQPDSGMVLTLNH